MLLYSHSPPDSPEWTSAGCYFNSITPCQVCCIAPAWTNRIGGNKRLNLPSPHCAVGGKVWPAALVPSIPFIPALKHLSLITGAPHRRRDQELGFSGSQIKLKVLSLTSNTSTSTICSPQNMNTRNHSTAAQSSFKSCVLLKYHLVYIAPFKNKL